jgi:hypothetical protein
MVSFLGACAVGTTVMISDANKLDIINQGVAKWLITIPQRKTKKFENDPFSITPSHVDSGMIRQRKRTKLDPNGHRATLYITSSAYHYNTRHGKRAYPN